MPRFLRRALALGSSVALLVACAEAEPIQYYSLEGGDDASDGSLEAAPDAPTDAPTETTPDAPSDAGVDAATGCRCDDPGCGTCPTMPIVAAGGYGIDATEVTNQDYAAFLATNPLPAAQKASCAFNTSFTPSQDWPAAATALAQPVVYVDFCDAEAYCTWARKRLCGRISGGGNPYGDFGDSTKSQWHNACSGGGTKQYPYGASYDGTKCNGADFGLAQALPAGDADACIGGYPDLFDMSGNVWEWEDSCNGSAGASDLCRIRGGSYAQNAGALGCAADSALSRDTRGKSVGFRCCE